MKFSTQPAKHLIEKARPVQPTEACQIGRLGLVFSPRKFTHPFYCLVGWRNKLQRQRPSISSLVLGIQIWNPLLEVGWLILIYLNEPVVGRNPHRDSLSLLQCIFPTFSDLLYHFDWWLSPLEFFTLSLPQSPPLFPICLLTKRIAQRTHCSKSVIFHPEQSCLPGGIWKYLETFFGVTTMEGGKLWHPVGRGQWAL